MLTILVFLTACFGMERDNEFYEIGEYGADQTGDTYDGYEEKELTIAQSAPPNYYTEIGFVKVSVGQGCDARGVRGTHPMAIKELKKQADKYGADYAQIVRVIKPHSKPGCFVNTYVMRAKLFRDDEETLQAQRRRARADLPQETSQKSPSEKLRELKALLDEGIISQADYEKKKNKILAEGY